MAKVALSTPHISINSPADGSSFLAGSGILITGSASDPVTMNEKPVAVMDASGNFFNQVVVSPGENDYLFAARDQYGQTATAKLVLFGTQPQPGAIDFSLFSDVSASFTGDYARTSFNEDTNILYADLRVRNAGQYPADAPLIVGVKNISRSHGPGGGLRRRDAGRHAVLRLHDADGRQDAGAGRDDRLPEPVVPQTPNRSSSPTTSSSWAS